jgi:hypothetical protein
MFLVTGFLLNTKYAKVNTKGAKDLFNNLIYKNMISILMDDD